jgi:glycosyltransferase involved in cell wall biosynthesis
MGLIVAIVEARTVTGPAKNLIRFASENRERLKFHFLTYARTATEAEANSYTNLFIESARTAGIPVANVWEQGRFDRGAQVRLLRAVHQLRPQAVQTHSVKSHFLTAHIRRKLGARWIAFHHGYTAEDVKMRLFNQLDRYSLPRAAAVVTVCEAFAGGLENYGVKPERLHVLHNSLDPGWARRPGLEEDAARLRARWPGQTVVLLCVGRFSKEKGHSTLIRALAEVRPRTPVFLVLIGDGPLRADVEALVRAERLEECVFFAGQQKDVRPYFAAANALVLPSLSEGSPNVLLEAMAARLPIVSTRAGGACEIVSDRKTALVVPTNDPGALARAIQHIAGDAELRAQLAARAYTRLIEHFSPAAYDAKLFGIYESVLGSGQ